MNTKFSAQDFCTHAGVQTFQPPPLRVEDPHPTGQSPVSELEKLIFVLFFWPEFCLEIDFRYPVLTSIYPPVYPNFTSFQPLLKLTCFNLCFFGNLQPWFGNHVYRPLGQAIAVNMIRYKMSYSSKGLAWYADE